MYDTQLESSRQSRESYHPTWHDSDVTVETNYIDSAMGSEWCAEVCGKVRVQAFHSGAYALDEWESVTVDGVETKFDDLPECVQAEMVEGAKREANR